MVDLAVPLRSAIIGDATVTGELSAYMGSYPVFTKRPVPDDAPSKLIIVSPDIILSDEDGLSDLRPVITRDISVYGTNGVAGTVDDYRSVERVGYALRDLFHRRPQAIAVSGYDVARIEVAGPMPAPADDDQTVGRMVTLTVRLAKQS